jgi:hypothetical protein
MDNSYSQEIFYEDSNVLPCKFKKQRKSPKHMSIKKKVEPPQLKLNIKTKQIKKLKNQIKPKQDK